jgi:AcrR family transcriptional regulator
MKPEQLSPLSLYPLTSMTALGSNPDALAARPLRADAARNRARLLEAARELFAARGLSVTMDEIARHAGVGVGTAYRRFASREELIEALFDERIEQVVANAEAAVRDPDPWHGLVTMLERQLEMQAEDRGLKELLFSPALIREKHTTVRARMLPLVEEVFARAQASGDLRPDVRPTDLAGINFMVGSAADLGGDIAPELWRRYLAIVLDGLRSRRDGASPLPAAPLADSQLDAAMANCHERRR